MKAILQDVYGDAGVLRLGEADEPTIGDDEVLVRVHAAGVDRGVWHLMTGSPALVRLGIGLRRPRQPIRGAEFAGRVERVGSKVTTYGVGDPVFGVGDGTYAELTRARATRIARIPAGVTFEQAAACPISAVSALQAVRDLGRLKSGQRVLIFGAGGGVGTFAVQLARHFGGDVTGVCRPAKAERVRELGAHLDVTGRYDLIIDTAGLRSLRTLRELLTPRGTAVIVGGEGHGGRLLAGFDRQMRALVVSPFVGQRLVPMVSITKGEDLETIAGLLGDGSLRAVLDRVYPLAETPAALRRLATGEVTGKVVVQVASA